MRTVILLILAAFLAKPAYSAELPTAGTCEPKAEEGGFRILPTITWVGREALLKQGNKTYKGEVVGLRRHDAAFKFSVFYRDDIMGMTEVTVFRIPNSKPSQDRMGAVHYNELPNGQRVISAIFGFTDAKCAVQF
jgi:hypothetical protein